jgi:hypothetical protein
LAADVAAGKKRQLTRAQQLPADAFLKKIAIFITQLYYCSGFLITLTQNSSVSTILITS